MEKLTDEQLMELYKGGDFDAFGVLYDRHKSKIYGHLKKKLQSCYKADEVYQNVFFNLHRFRHKYNDSFPFLPWIFVICRNALVDYVRKQNVRKETVPLNEEIIEHLSVGPGPKEQNIEDYVPYIAQLDEKQKKAIQLRFKEDFSFEDIAKEFKTSPSNARQIVSRSIRKLKGIIAVKGINDE